MTPSLSNTSDEQNAVPAVGTPSIVDRLIEKGLPRKWKSQLIARFWLLLICAFYLMPLYWMLRTSVMSSEDLTQFPPPLWPTKFRWENFVETVNFIPFGTYYWNSIQVTAISAFGIVFSSFLVAYGFAKIKWPGRDLLFYTVLGSIFIFVTFPVNPVTMLPLFKLFAEVGWINTYMPLILPTFFGNPLYIFLLRQFLQQIPDSISEAARIDGASDWGIFTRVIMPLSKPALGVTAILSSVSIWNDFLGPKIYLYDDDKYTLALGLTMYRSREYVNWELLMAASTLALLPVVVIFFVFQRTFVEGISMGSVK